MVADAKTDSFNLGVAELRIGPKDKLRELTKEHSVGLVKDFQVDCSSESIDLTSGIQADLVFSVKGASTIKCTSSLFEYTAKNLNLALGREYADTLDLASKPTYLMNSAIVGDGTASTDITIASATDITATMPAGTWLALQGQADGANLFYAKVVTAVFAVDTVTITLDKALPTGMGFVLGDKVILQNSILVGDGGTEGEYAMMATFIMPAGNTPMTLFAPKIKINSGFSLVSSVTDYGSLPFDIKIMKQLASDPFYNDPDFAGASAKLFTSK